MSDSPISFRELREAGIVAQAAPQSLTASDGVRLSYRQYVPASPRAVVLFYHGGGAHGAAGYQYLANGLQQQFSTATCLPDIRGHGASEGLRGDAPSPRQVWADIATFIKHVRAEFPGLPLFLGGHSSGAGLTLNYASQQGHEPVDGYIFLSPEFGFRSNTARPSHGSSFASVNVRPFIVNAMSKGLLFGHSRAVQLHYPSEVLALDSNLVSSYSVNMANALTPLAPHKQFAALDRAFGLWIGSEDELIVPGMVLAFADLAASIRSNSLAISIPGGKHLSVLVKAHEVIGPWIAGQVSKRGA